MNFLMLVILINVLCLANSAQGCSHPFFSFMSSQNKLEKIRTVSTQWESVSPRLWTLNREMVRSFRLSMKKPVEGDDDPSSRLGIVQTVRMKKPVEKADESDSKFDIAKTAHTKKPVEGDDDPAYKLDIAKTDRMKKPGEKTDESDSRLGIVRTDRMKKPGEKTDKSASNSKFDIAKTVRMKKPGEKADKSASRLSVKKSKRKATKILKKYSSIHHSFVVEVMAEDLGIIWGMVFISDNEILFTERHGHIKKLNIDDGKLSSVSGAPKVYARGQGGLLDIALHPRFSENKKLYLSYSKIKKRKQTTAVAVGVLKKGKITLLKDIFVARPAISSSRHFGSRLVFDKKGFLYVTVGDRANRQFAQGLDNHLGKVLRLTDEGQPPKNNPFVSVKGALPEIWSLGHRNPQGLFLHPETGRIWEQEHGPRGGDEINLIKKGKNYGWPTITYGREYWGPKIGEGFRKKGMEQPIKYYTPSIAPSGLIIYSGKKFKKWKNSFFSGALVLKHLNRVKIINQKVFQEERLLSDLHFRVRHVIEGPKGFIYLSVDKGKILRLKPI